MTAIKLSHVAYILVAVVAFLLGSRFLADGDTRSTRTFAQEVRQQDDRLIWRRLNGYGLGVDAVVHRAKVHGGWLVSVRLNTGNGPANVDVTFYPDAQHQWSGVSFK